ncbi:MAG: group II intron reverse transcriptase/maturase [Oscillospiraceae bacterium]
MPVLTSEQRNPKRSKIRYTEYYALQETLDGLYADSEKGKMFTHLMEIIVSSKNIKLAYRTIKGNTGSNTAGVDKRTIQDLAKLDEGKYVALIQKQFRSYHPRPVRRVEIPKPNGKTRPLGIPTIVDRIVQQCVLQVLEPICEAKFYDHSYGFRPNRSTEHAISRCNQLIQLSHLYYAVDIDIKGFFDNVNHTKLIQQMWQMGIRDKHLLCIVREMLKAPIVLPDGKMLYPDKGTPQGGILSPLLSNIVLNELDWWIASQWEQMPMHGTARYFMPNKNGSMNRGYQYRVLKKESHLKQVFIVRYADDFKLFCSNRKDAFCIFEATKQWLKERLSLDISPEKSKVVNLKQHYSEYLGFKMKARSKGKKHVVCSHMSDKARAKAKSQLSECIKAIQHPKSDQDQHRQIFRYNSIVVGMHNYYCVATCVNLDFSAIAYAVGKQMKNRLGRQGLSKQGKLEKGYIKERYGKSQQIRFLKGHPLVPVGYIKHKNPLGKKRSINRYTEDGRAEIHKMLGVNTDILTWLMRNPRLAQSVEYADNRISLYAAQYGKCAITGKPLNRHEIHCHHKIPKTMGGTDAYSNLVIVSEAVHQLMHATDEVTILRHLKTLNLDAGQTKKLNKLREQASLRAI